MQLSQRFSWFKIFEAHNKTSLWLHLGCLKSLWCSWSLTTTKKFVNHDIRVKSVNFNMAVNTHSSLAVAGELPFATVQSPAPNSATAIFVLHLCSLDACSWSHVETCRWDRKGTGSYGWGWGLGALWRIKATGAQQSCEWCQCAKTLAGFAVDKSWKTVVRTTLLSSQSTRHKRNYKIHFKKIEKDSYLCNLYN